MRKTRVGPLNHDPWPIGTVSRPAASIGSQMKATRISRCADRTQHSQLSFTQETGRNLVSPLISFHLLANRITNQPVNQFSRHLCKPITVEQIAVSIVVVDTKYHRIEWKIVPIKIISIMQERERERERESTAYRDKAQVNFQYCTPTSRNKINWSLSTRVICGLCCCLRTRRLAKPEETCSEDRA